MFKALIEWYRNLLESWGYPLVALLMAIESSIVPLPSELVIPPAAHIGWTQEKFNLVGVQVHGRLAVMIGLVIAGAVGSWIGATAMYWVSRWLGRPLVLKYGKYVFITPEKVHGAERWAAHYGSLGIFVSRLLPVVRHLIGIPAGIVKMDYLKFSIYTLLGSAIWCAVLCWMGVHFGGQITHGQGRSAGLGIGGVFLVIGALYYVFVHRHMKAEGQEKTGA